MQFSDQSYNLRIELDTKECDFSPEEIHKIEQGLHPLRDLVRDFPVSDLYITVAFHPRSNHYTVKTSLVLPGRTLSTGDEDDQAYSAFQRSIRRLVANVQEYKEELENRPEFTKQQEGTHHEVFPLQPPDAQAVEQAVAAGDYTAFREALFVYEEPIRKRAGRWIERYPEAAARVGDELQIADVVEEVFLNAFEQYARRPDEVRLGEWLEGLIDPSLKEILKHPAREKENINFARSAWQNEPGE